MNRAAEAHLEARPKLSRDADTRKRLSAIFDDTKAGKRFTQTRSSAGELIVIEAIYAAPIFTRFRLPPQGGRRPKTVDIRADLHTPIRHRGKDHYEIGIEVKTVTGVFREYYPKTEGQRRARAKPWPRTPPRSEPGKGPSREEGVLRRQEAKRRKALEERGRVEQPVSKRIYQAIQGKVSRGQGQGGPWVVAVVVLEPLPRGRILARTDREALRRLLADNKDVVEVWVIAPFQGKKGRRVVRVGGKDAGLSIAIDE